MSIFDNFVVNYQIKIELLFVVLLPLGKTRMIHAAKLLLLLNFVTLATSAQHSIIRVEFEKSGRGSKEHLTILKDSMQLRIENPTLTKNFSKTINSKKWAQLSALIGHLTLSEIPELKSPTMNRTFDGALHGSLTFTTDDGKSYTHGFDDENPHPKLSKVMRCVQEIRDEVLRRP